MSKVVDYIEGCDRNNPHLVRSHMYAITKAGHYWPMCDYGWNRSDGERLSILRGRTSNRGTCKLCLKNIKAGKRPVINAFKHKTRWL